VEQFTWLVEAIFVPVVVLHVFETWLLERTKLQKFGVRRGSAVWWKWVVSVFIEGAMAFKRFDLVVAKLRAQGKKGR
jgi:predicted CDP-diglyceride synthetase/phosphatidate cytidylyltransferase